MKILIQRSMLLIALRCGLVAAPLCAALPLSGEVIISEFMALNTSTIQDEDGTTSDWIELHNQSAGSVDLAGWHLTDDEMLLTQWTLPATNLTAGARLLVFASGMNRSIAGAELHTNFKLTGDGEFLALVKPDGTTITTQFAPFPPQRANISYGYGTGLVASPLNLAAADAPAKLLIPTGALEGNWRNLDFDDSGWSNTQMGVGFGAVGSSFATVACEIPSGRSGSQAFNGALGMDFYVVEAVAVTALGVFDDGSDGLKRTITAQLWSRNDGGTVEDGSDDSGGVVLKSKIFTPDDPGTLLGGSRFKPLAQPLVLQPGAYTIVAYGYGTGEQNGNAASFTALNDGGGLLGFLHVRWGNTPGAFPNVLQAGIPGQFGAGAFKFIAADNPLVRTDLEDEMKGINASALLRIPFVVADPDALTTLALEIACNDGFDAYLNGTRVAQINSPPLPTWNSSATATTNFNGIIDLTAYLNQLRPGTNILAVQGMNNVASDSSFLIALELTGESHLPTRLYFTAPTPGAPNSTGVEGLDVVINEIHYKPASESAPAEFVELYNPTGQNVDLSGWSLSDGIDFTFPPATEILSNGYLVVAMDTNFFATAFPSVASIGPFSKHLSSSGETLTLRNVVGGVVDSVSYKIGAPWPVAGDAPYNSIQLLHPGLDNELGGSWRARKPTPGARNAGFAVQQPPQIRQVSHEPRSPSSGDEVIITAKVTDPDGVESVALEYQLVEPGSYIRATDPEFQSSWSVIAMALVGDGGYSATIPGTVQVHRRLVRYRISAEDKGGAKVRLPLPSDPSLNFAYFVYDGAPAWRGADKPGVMSNVIYSAAVMNSLPIYHLISRDSDVLNCQYNAAYNDKVYRFEGALVYDGEVYDHMHYRIRGSASTYQTGKNKWKLRFNRGRWFQGSDDYGVKYQEKVRTLNFSALSSPWASPNRGMAGLDEGVAFRMFQLAGVPAHNTSFFNLRVVDALLEQNSSSQYEGDNWGLYMAMEQADRRFLDERGMTDGNLFNMHFGASSVLNQAFGQPADRSDLFAFIGTSSLGYNYTAGQSAEWWESNVDLDNYFSYRSVLEVLNHSDCRDQENSHLYHNPLTGRWTMLPWDLDLLYEEFDRWGPDGLQNQSALEQFRKCLVHEELNVRFQNRARELQDLLLNSDQGWTLYNEFASLVANKEEGLGWPEVDRARWDHDPRSRSVHGPNPGANYYVTPFTYPSWPWITRVLDSPDFAGVTQWAKDFIVPTGFGGAQLAVLANNPLIPATPTITYLGDPGYPANALRFATSPYATAPGGTGFASLEWRVGEVCNPGTPGYVAGTRWIYEVETLWSSGELKTFANQRDFPLLQQGHTYRARVRHKDQSGRCSHWSSPMEFTAGEADNAAALRECLQISELMYHAVAGSAFDYIEFYNSSASLALELSGVAITEGISYTFPAATTLPAGGYIVLAKTPGASFDALYGTVGVTVLGPYEKDFSNSGESVTVEPPGGGAPLISFTYSDGRGWPVAADGSGHSLVPTAPADGLDYGGNWRPSTLIGGSPGAADPTPIPTVVINEFAAHTANGQAAPFESGDWIELYNPLAVPVDIGGWYLSDDSDNLRRYQIAPGTTMGAGTYLVLTESQHYHANPVDLSGFGLDKDGEQLFLSSLPGDGSDRVVDAVAFKAQAQGASLGRYPDGGAWWYTLPPTRGSINGAPVPRVLISEIMYHSAVAAIDGSEDLGEYLEICNATDAPVELWNSAGSWRIDGGVSYSFAPGTMLAPGGSLLVLSFDPVANAAARQTFLETYGLTDGQVVLCGPYVGRLNNRGERIALEAPQAADPPGAIPSWMIVDEVIYFTAFPWPGNIGGLGFSLGRPLNTHSGNDPAIWSAGVVSPGGALVDLDRDGLPDGWEWAHFGNFHATAAGQSGPDHMSNIDKYTAGLDPNDPTSTFRLDIDLVSDSLAVVSLLGRKAEGPGYEGIQRLYWLEQSTNLVVGGWSIIPGFIDIPGMNRSILYTNQVRGAHFYRAGVRLEDKFYPSCP